VSPTPREENLLLVQIDGGVQSGQKAAEGGLVMDIYLDFPIGNKLDQVDDVGPLARREVHLGSILVLEDRLEHGTDSRQQQDASLHNPILDNDLQVRHLVQALVKMQAWSMNACEGLLARTVNSFLKIYFFR
jgi:hypothetical protein